MRSVVVVILLPVGDGCSGLRAAIDGLYLHLEEFAGLRSPWNGWRKRLIRFSQLAIDVLNSFSLCIKELATVASWGTQRVSWRKVLVACPAKQEPFQTSVASLRGC